GTGLRFPGCCPPWTAGVRGYALGCALVAWASERCRDAGPTLPYRPDGWVATGDLGHFDSDGYLYVDGRKKDIVVTRAGYKIAPSPIEQMILSDPTSRRP